MNPSERAQSYSGENGSNADDVALMRRIVEADETALGALYDRWVRSLYSLVLHLLKDPDEAEDVVEETFWQAWRKADSYEPSKGAVSTWLLTIGRRKALDRLRSRKRSKEDAISDERTFADLPSNAPDPAIDQPLERSYGGIVERSACSVRAVVVEFHRVRDLWLYLSAEHHKADARAAHV